MDIVYTLKKFFNEQQDEAAIPGLGVFFKATIDENGNPLPEENPIIQFIEKTPRSNAFVNFLGYEENLTENEAIEIIEQWVSTILNDLKTHKLANIPGLGSFEIKNDKVFFNPAVNQSCYLPLPNEYGLDGTSVKNIEYGLENIPEIKRVKKSEKSAEKPAFEKEKQSTNRVVLWVIICAVIVVLIGGGIACYKTIPGFKCFVDSRIESARGSFRGEAKPIVISHLIEEIEEIDDMFTEDDFTEPAQSPEQTSKITSKSEVITTQQPAAQPAKPATQVATSQMPFNVIGGAFSMKGNADNFLAQMRREGYSAEIIFDGQRQLHLVSLGGFRTLNEALEFKENIRATKGIGCWIFRR
jgi:cell division septation protein DedD